MTAIDISEVSKIFQSWDGDAVVALEDINLNIPENQFISLVGPSGCGKSTLLRLLGGLISPTAGNLKISDTPVSGPRKETGIVFQKATLLPWKSILDNVLFPLSVMKELKPDSEQIARDLLELAGLDGFENKYPDELSGGMQQRAGICRALVHDPKILLMDEPFGALDALTREEMSLELLRIWTERPKTIVFVTHSITEAVLMSDRVVVMSPRPGRIQEIIDIPIPRPRTFEVEALHEFQECAQRIRYLITGK
jgi:NitT/TauT family transport system ATP-binding protein